MKKEKNIVLILICVLVLIDQILKIYIINADTELIFSNGWEISAEKDVTSEDNVIYIAINLLMILFLVRYIRSNNVYIKLKNKLVLSFAIAGVASNLIDRIWNGSVINYIKIPQFTTLNLAYIYILVMWIGMAALMTSYTMERIKEKNGKKANSRK